MGHGAVCPVARQDLAEAAAHVLVDIASGSGARHVGAVYELDGVEQVNGSRIAEVLGARYDPVDMASTRQMLLASGAPAYQVGHAMSIHANIAASLLTPHHTTSRRC